jgi:hypothetical protein
LIEATMNRTLGTFVMYLGTLENRTTNRSSNK